MSSFKLESGGSAKEQAKGAGWLLVALGIVVAVLVYTPAGLGMLALGAILLAGSAGASS